MLCAWFDVAILYIAGAAFDEESRRKTKQCDGYRHDPGTFFQYVGGLFYTHELGVEAGDIASQSTTFRVLDEDEQAHCNARYNDQDQEENHITVLLFVQYELQNKGIWRDSANLISRISLWLSVCYLALPTPRPWLL